MQCLKKATVLLLPLLLHSFAIPTVLRDHHDGVIRIERNGRLGEGGEREREEALPAAAEAVWIREYRLDQTATIRFSLPCVDCVEEEQQRVTNEGFTISIAPSEQLGCSTDADTGIQINGESVLAAGTDTTRMKRSGSSLQLFPGSALAAHWQLSCACLRSPNAVSGVSTEDCNEWGYILSVNLGTGVVSSNGFMLSYKQSPTPQLLRLSPFNTGEFDGSLAPLQATRHWLLSSPLIPTVGEGSTESGILTTGYEPTSSSLGSTSTLSLLSLTRTGLVALPTVLEETHTITVVPEMSPTSPPSSQDRFFQAPARYNEQQQDRIHLKDIVNKLKFLSSKAGGTSQTMFGNLGQTPLAYEVVPAADVSHSLSSQPSISPPPSPPLQSARPVPQLRNDQALLAFQLTSAIVVIVSLSTLAFACLRRDPRRRADLAARREERRNRRLYRNAACRHKWRSFLTRIKGMNVMDNAFRSSLESVADPISAPRLEDTRLDIDTLGEPFWHEKPTGIAIESGGDASTSEELSALRKAHRFVEGILQAEAGFYSPSIYPVSSSAAAAAARYQRRYSNSYSEKSGPPPYEEEGEAIDVVVVDGIRFAGRRVGAGSDSTPASSIIAISAPTSVCGSSDCEKD